ncbi:MAG: methionine ABC transporter ATP-binding protein [Gammaproteobacteria bacterium RIFCSPLOWO2_02_FULL_42_14]|nr:MAG: methionine ABC transporter ATP-binding protein [Gammaproteobacteria bacterium RIFCSPHIGHO2_02_FULL_42_43]OGT28146.1 MAG: methionine ABC transporter ATP-binding protein [Gammaproteobacteria bacterium RIFCSPHIGHO2_01_FULL_42_8]OGT51713.1 MAG: methionine ABC transporter ATP-binding protein [Gammaproteobacteria bacterium RIFCSPHIGHO2_12_FULL_41_25]OGT61610.1 MAG: methionine ABC transporter ATP-binding protein [Gammaproteobacteria bacterium RIFCSPLOWO2_02_FULL_42_14]OGT86234.1 MAG: methionin
MINLSHLNKTYQTKTHTLHALKNIHLQVNAGEIVGVIGKSGAGKSTLIRCVNLLERPSSGSVIVNGVDLMSLDKKALRQVRHQIGMVFQHFNLLETRTAFDNVALPLELLQKSRVEIKNIVTSLLEKVGLSAFQHKYPCELSGGQKQRVAIARALATHPRVLLCDEMTSALDPETTEEILSLVRTLNQELKLSILCITHEMHVVKSIADRVAVIDEGEIVECATVVDLFKHPQTDIAKRLTQSVLKAELPEQLRSQLQSQPFTDSQIILRLTFLGHATLEPVINEFMRETKLRMSILEAHIEYLRNELIGSMLLSVEYQENVFEQAKLFLEKKGVLIQVMGYVGR